MPQNKEKYVGLKRGNPTVKLRQVNMKMNIRKTDNDSIE